MKRSELFFSAITLPLDYLALLVAGLGAYFLRYWSLVQNIRPVIFDLPFVDYLPILSLAALGWVFIFALAGLYKMGSTQKISDEISKIFVACSAGLALVLAVMVFSRYLFDSRFIILVSWVLAVILISLERIIVRQIQRQVLNYGIGIHRVVIIGQDAVGKMLSKELADNSRIGYRIVKEINEINEQIFIDLKQMIGDDKFDEIILTNSAFPQDQIKKLLEFIDDYHLTFNYAANLIGIESNNLLVKNIAGVPIVEVKKTKLDGWGRIYKRLFDIIGSAILIILFSPVLIIIAIAIKLDSPGTVFFKYSRVGQNGKPFIYFKFRSMIKDAHKYRFNPEFLSQHQNLRDGTPMMKFKDDPRITRVGKFIRRWSLDELPELFLVLIGKMSLVGPRPHEVEEVEKYRRDHKKVLTLKPGITGLAQVSGRSDLSFDEEVKLDVYYIENWSFGIDWRIIFKTPLAVLRHRGAE
ncbi:MAG: sugar transferase [Candidatus Buchananbacteria bacterium]|nr:sugar transferase [Candidatus Buchananbacteria bacterium]